MGENRSECPKTAAVGRKNSKQGTFFSFDTTFLSFPPPPPSALWLSVLFCMQVTSVSVGGGCKWAQRFSSAAVCLLSEEEDGAQCSRARHQWDSILLSGEPWSLKGHRPPQGPVMGPHPSTQHKTWPHPLPPTAP